MSDSVRQDEFGKDLGLVHEVVVTGRKVGAGSEFWSALAHDEELFRKVVGIVLPQTFQLTESEQIAADILGLTKVAGYNAACQAWNMGPAKSVPVMSFSEEALKQCAKENENGADWRVVYVHGFSLRQQEKYRGRNRKKQPCFDPDYTWWLEKEQDVWGKQAVEAGYRLFDFSGRFGSMKWQTQEAKITKLGDCYERAEEQAVAEACFTFYLVSGKKERLLKDFWHWGRLLTASSRHVGVGAFGERGFSVRSYWGGYSYDRLRVVLSRKF